MNDRILPLFALAAAIIIFFVYVNPTWGGSIATTKAAIALDDQALAAAQEYTTQQNALIAARDAIDPSQLSKLSTFLPDSVDNVGLILDLNALAARSGISLSNIDVAANDSNGTPNTASGKALTGDPIGSANMTLSAVGTFDSLQAFLRGIEQSARILDVQDVVVKGSDTGVYTYQMSIRLYWLR